LLATAALVLAVANTVSVAGARAFNDVDAQRAGFERLLRDGDLVITPGWDDLGWMSMGHAKRTERLLLMELAMDNGDLSIEQLPAEIRARLVGGDRVLVVRVYDLDRRGRPWEQLAKLGWPRLQDLFAGFASKPIARIDDVVIRELTLSESTARAR
jgi:hypothetical protein